MELQVCDILLKKGKMIGSIIIREITADNVPLGQSYSHSGIYAGNGKIYDARNPAVGLYNLDYEDYDVYRVNLTDEQRAKILAYCQSRVGTPYALKDLVLQGIEEIFHIPTQVDLSSGEWCSTFVVKAFARAGILLTRKPLPTPNDIGWSVITTKVS